MPHKYQMTRAAALRIGAAIVSASAATLNCRYVDVLEALRAEGFARPEREVRDLLGELRGIAIHADKPSERSDAAVAHAAIAAAAATEARDAREKLAAVRGALSAIGVAFHDELGPKP